MLTMKKIQVYIVPICLLPLFVPGPALSSASYAPQDLAARIQRVENGLIPNPGIVIKGQPPGKAGLAERMKVYRVPGLSIAVINGYELEGEEGYGIRESGRTSPVPPETLFQAASISKPVAAATALYYVERGILRFDAGVNSRLRSWKIPENAWTRQGRGTLRELLSHTAGVAH